MNKADKVVFILAAILVAVLAWFSAQPADGAESKRTMFPESWSYSATQDVEFSSSLSFSSVGDPTLILTATFTTDTAIDIYAEYRIWQYRELIQQFLTETDPEAGPNSGGGYISKWWGWQPAKQYGGSYSGSPAGVSVVYASQGYGDFIAYGDLQFEFRFRIAYLVDGKRYEPNKWYWSETYTVPRVPGSVSPTLVDTGTGDIISFVFGETRSAFRIRDVTAHDGADGDLVRVSGRYVSQLTGEKRNLSDAYGGGVGVEIDLAAYQHTETIEEMIASGDYLWQAQIKVTDVDGNTTGWQNGDLVDLTAP